MANGIENKILKRELSKTESMESYDTDKKCPSAVDCDNFGIAYVPKKFGTYEFLINDWNILPSNPGYHVNCPTFSITGFDKWTLEVYPRGVDIGDEGHVSMVLRNETDCDFRIHCDVSVYGNKIYNNIATSNAIEELEPKGSKNDSWFARKVLSFDEASTWTYQNAFAIKIQLMIACNIEVCKPDKPQGFQNEQIPTLGSDLLALMDDSWKSDVVLVCGEERINGHQSLLAARSSVIKSHLTSSATMVKLALNGGKFYLKVKPGVFHDVVKFIYTDSCSPTIWVKPGESEDDPIYDLYQASIKYDIRGLKFRCEDFLLNNLSVENVCNILQVADEGGGAILKNMCLKFISLHTHSIVTSPGFGRLNADLCRQVLGEVSHDLHRYPESSEVTNLPEIEPCSNLIKESRHPLINKRSNEGIASPVSKNGSLDPNETENFPSQHSNTSISSDDLEKLEKPTLNRQHAHSVEENDLRYGYEVNPTINDSEHYPFSK